ncbi:MAG: GYD domain-containing protein [Candidatus Bathyarchaeota archaeon]|nr:MAG: GYD domain-containing protein [Candidatus Bathyarchaeota archaeon]
MIFITLGKWNPAPKKEMIDQATKRLEELEKQGIKMRVNWTLGRYDVVAFTEAPTEKDAMKALLSFQNLVDTETMVAIPRKEGIKLL